MKVRLQALALLSGPSAELAEEPRIKAAYLGQG
jgi:hypothetical protein